MHFYHAFRGLHHLERELDLELVRFGLSVLLEDWTARSWLPESWICFTAFIQHLYWRWLHSCIDGMSAWEPCARDFLFVWFHFCIARRCFLFCVPFFGWRR